MLVVSGRFQNYQNGPVNNQLTNIGRGILGVTVNLLMYNQGVTKRCRLSLLTNSALVRIQVPMRGGGGGVAGSQPMRTAVHITRHGAQINFGYLRVPPFLT
jgi:hypothetical protein